MPTSKLRELIVYLCDVCQDDPAFGSTKLNKLLYFADFSAYRKWGHPITEATYRRLPHGPAPTAMKPTLDAMQADGSLAIAQTEFFTQQQKRPIALRPANLRPFTAEEIALVDHVLRHFAYFNAAEISDASHETLPWLLAADGAEIPYAAALLSRRELTPNEVAYADSIDLSDLCEAA